MSEEPTTPKTRNRPPKLTGDDWKTKEVWSAVEVGQYLGCSLSAARSWIYRMNIPRCPGSRRHVSPADVNKALKEGAFPRNRGTSQTETVAAGASREDTSFD